MKKEHRLILDAVLIKKSKEEIKKINTLLEEKLDWFEIAGILVNHRLGGYFYLGLDEQQQKKIPKEFRKVLELLVKAQKEQQNNNNTELLKINELLDDNGIRFAALKGAFFGSEMYTSGLRRSNDLDLLVYEEDLNKLDDCMRQLGYIQSNMPNGEMIEATKREKLIQRMNYHDLVPYVKSVDGGVLDIDINFLFDGKENPIDRFVYDMGTQIYDGENYSIRGLNYYTNLAFLCVHFYREASSTIWTEGRRDVTLYKIVDIINYIRFYMHLIDKEQLLSVFKKLNICEKVFFTFKIIQEFYNESSINEIIQDLKIYEIDSETMKKVYDHKTKKEIYREESFYEKAFKMI